MSKALRYKSSRTQSIHQPNRHRLSAQAKRVSVKLLLSRYIVLLTLHNGFM